MANAYTPSSVVSDVFSIGPEYTLDITSDVVYYNVRTEFISKYGFEPPTDVHLTVTVYPGVVVSGNGSSSFAVMRWPTFDVLGATYLQLINNGYILGEAAGGGNGASFNGGPITPGVSGYAGGSAINLLGATVYITNANGFIWGGGGGGGGGGNGSFGYGGGGGGAGAGSNGASSGSGGFGSITSGSNGGNSIGGVASTPGAGGAPGGDAGAGGAGGDFGQAGSNGAGATNFGFGGAAGYAINQGGGAAIFISGGSSPHVKGPIS